MKILQSVIDDIAVLSVSGKADATTSRDLEAALADRINQNKIFRIVDMKNIVFLKSFGPQVFIEYLNELLNELWKGNENQLLAALQSFAKEILSLATATGPFLIRLNLEQAIRVSQRQRG
jgi:hypothetical protein